MKETRRAGWDGHGERYTVSLVGHETILSVPCVRGAEGFR